jgi:uncharacterized protein YjiS (DUF1127 family)
MRALLFPSTLAEKRHRGDTPMKTASSLLHPRQAMVERRGFTILAHCRNALIEWRKRERVRAELNCLSDRELLDIGIARGEVDHVASNRVTDSRSVVFPP